jgi:hypothetical protein
MSLREVPCSKSNPLDGGEVLQKKKCTSSKHSNLKWTTSV